jgi:hypothetical protein
MILLVCGLHGDRGPLNIPRQLSLVLWFNLAVSVRFIDSNTTPLHRFYYIHFPSVSNYDSNPAVSVRFIDSTTSPLHRFYYIHFPSVCNYDSNPAVSVRFIDSTTSLLHRFYYIHFPSVSNYDSNPAVSVLLGSLILPLYRCMGMLHNVCDIPFAPWKLADWGIISSITYRKIES